MNNSIVKQAQLLLRQTKSAGFSDTVARSVLDNPLAIAATQYRLENTPEGQVQLQNMRKAHNSLGTADIAAGAVGGGLLGAGAGSYLSGEGNKLRGSLVGGTLGALAGGLVGHAGNRAFRAYKTRNAPGYSAVKKYLE